MPISRTQKDSTTTSARRSSDPLPTVDVDDSPIDNAVGYDIGDKEINLPQLQNEIEDLAKQTETNFATTSKADSTVLWIAPPSIPASAVADAVRDHQPNPNWGIPQAMMDFQAVLDRVRQDPEEALSDDDVKKLVKGMALNFSSFSIQSSPPTIIS